MIDYKSQFVKEVMDSQNVTREEAIKDALQWLGIDKEAIENIKQLAMTKKFNLRS